MTMLRISEKALSGLDRFRSSRGIRTRTKALEIMLEELGVNAAPEDNLLSQIFARPAGAKVLSEQEANALALKEVKSYRQKRS
jgi:trehalose-6-phosphate synthase